MEEQIHAPRIGELPNRRALNRATLIAAAVAAILLVTVVLPAEYGVDKTGVGGLLNLTEMGKLKRAAAEESAASTRVTALPPLNYLAGQSGVLSVALAPGEGREIKASMQKGSLMQYEWATNNLPVHYELHGEPRGAGKGVYTSYKTGDEQVRPITHRRPIDDVLRKQRVSQSTGLLQLAADELA